MVRKFMTPLEFRSLPVYTDINDAPLNEPFVGWDIEGQKKVLLKNGDRVFFFIKYTKDVVHVEGATIKCGGEPKW